MDTYTFSIFWRSPFDVLEGTFSTFLSPSSTKLGVRKSIYLRPPGIFCQNGTDQAAMIIFLLSKRYRLGRDDYLSFVTTVPIRLR